MTTLVLTVIGDDRAGLVSNLSQVITEHGGNWTTSRMAELAGKFAGIVQVDVDADAADALIAALEPLSGLLEITAHEAGVAHSAGTAVLELDIVADDRPGIIREITEVISREGASIDSLTSAVVEAPHAGGLLFTAHATIRATGDDAAARLREGLEAVAGELMVEVSFDR